MTECLVSPTWRQFVCRRCGHLISDCRPANIPNHLIPTIEEIDSCALCAKLPSPAPSTTSSKAVGEVAPSFTHIAAIAAIDAMSVGIGG